MEIQHYFYYATCEHKINNILHLSGQVNFERGNSQTKVNDLKDHLLKEFKKLISRNEWHLIKGKIGIISFNKI